MTKKNTQKPIQKEEAYFDVITHKEVSDLKKIVKRKDLFLYGILVVVILLLIAQTVALYMRPLSVVYNNSLTGEMIYMKGQKPKDYTTELSVRWFIKKAVQLKTCQDPDAAVNLTFLYNYMITPSLQKIWDAEKTDITKGLQYYDKNAKADFVMEKIRIEGDYTKGNTLSVLMLGKLYFRKAVGWDGKYNENAIIPVFVKAAIQVHEQQERIPFGLLLNYYEVDHFESEDMRRSFLIKANLFQDN